jgi:predicted ATP-grasp superfamily ATP-dependent carboligase
MLNTFTASTRASEKLNLLVIGLDVASLAASANRLGHNVYSVDYFGDSDLKRSCKESLSIIKQIKGESCGRLDENFSPEKLLELVKVLLKRHRIDAALLASGLDDFPEVLSSINDLVQILGNEPNSISNVRDKERFYRNLRRLNIPHPETEVAEDLQGAEKKAKEIGYPVIVKPEKGFGGFGVRKALNFETLKSAFKAASSISQRVLIQEFIQGKVASASLISKDGRALTLTVNEQILGVSSLGQREPFGYCGNIVPLSASEVILERCRDVAERVVSLNRLSGSNGVDFVVSEEGIPKVVEVNPRFQGTMECVELVHGVNIFKAHLDACTRGVLPEVRKNRGIYCSRLILFAKERIQVPDLNTFTGVRDTPLPGAIVEGGEPICSVIREGLSRENSLLSASDLAAHILQSLRSVAG